MPFQDYKEGEAPLIYIITPTYKRPTRYADFMRLLYTLLHLKNIHWLIIEDGETTDVNIEKLLSAYDIQHTYFAQINNLPKKKRSLIRGMDQRNAGLNWIRLNHNIETRAVLYFADDDNAYSLEIFDEIRFTKKVAVFPVGLTNDEVIVRNGKVVRFGKQRKNYQRKFAVDMAAFAINVDVLFRNPKLQFESKHPGYLETNFLEKITTMSELEPKSYNCTRVRKIKT
ncbi:hypothetical protein FSP39_017297 [Pinctada imbricata]|uniref:Galactosylgalactosylxylosylprotein 3-beta-glucuronosyltransferase n=1 Tax=Pinctada imbricata TaxID=66713 RepID=A0AA88XNX8_PINIB|nr:hypothetical protein FSP39_017297 [Pinctada imbricata]